MDPSNPIFNFLNAAFASEDGILDLGDEDGEVLEYRFEFPPRGNSTQPPFGHQTAPATGSQAQQDADVRMDTTEDDDMPELQNVSDSSDDESDRDAHEVEMQAVDAGDDIPSFVPFRPSQAPSSSAEFHTLPSMSARTNSNRRARVDDDDDDERDRRHPSERVSSAPPSVSSSRATSSAPLPHNPAHAPRSATPTPQTQPRQTTVHHHIFHTTVNMGRGGAPNPHPFFGLFRQMMANVNNNNGNPANNANNANNTPTPNPAATNDANAPQPEPQEPRRQARDFPAGGIEGGLPFFGGMAVSFDLGPGMEGLPIPIPMGGPMPHPPNAAPNGDNADTDAPPVPEGHAPEGHAPEGQAPAPAPGQAPPNRPPIPTSLGELFASIGLNVVGGGGAAGIPININFGGLGLGGFGMENEKEDPERAKKLVEELEEVPIGLVKRLIRVGGTGGGMGEDESKGGDAGCAICWDSLLDAEGEGFGKQEAVPAPETEGESATTTEDSSSTATDKAEAKQQPRIVSLPCAHVFHADCLIPWFSRPRQTTCPTCRFNIDPDNLTYVSWRRRQRDRQEAEAAARAADPNAPAPAQDEQQPDAEGAEGAPNANANANEGPEEQAGRRFPRLPIPGGFMADLGEGRRMTVEFFDGPLPAPRAPTGATHDAPPVPGADAGALPHPMPAQQHAWPGGMLDEETMEAQERMFEEQYQFAMRMFGDPSPPRGRMPARGGAAGGANGANEAGNANANTANDNNNNANNNPTDDGADAAPAVAQQLPEPTIVMPLPQGSVGPAQHFPPTPAPAQGPVGAAPPPQQPAHQGPQQPRLPPFPPNLFNTGNGIHGFHLASGSGRTFDEAFSQFLTGIMRPPPQQQRQGQGQGQPQQQQQEQEQPQAQQGEHAPAAQAQPQPQPGATQEQAEGAAPAANAQPQPQPRAHPHGPHPPHPHPHPASLFGVPGALRLPALAAMGMGMGMPPDFFNERPERPKRAWTLPPAPGPTLRQRVERRERDAGLRCYDMSCGVGPSDEDPELGLAAGVKQLGITGRDGAEVCAHRFHGACLVSAERVAMRGTDVAMDGAGVEVSCPVCRGVGLVTKEEWDEGVVALA